MTSPFRYTRWHLHLNNKMFIGVCSARKDYLETKFDDVVILGYIENGAGPALCKACGLGCLKE